MKKFQKIVVLFVLGCALVMPMSPVTAAEQVTVAELQSRINALMSKIYRMQQQEGVSEEKDSFVSEQMTVEELQWWVEALMQQIRQLEAQASKDS